MLLETSFSILFSCNFRMIVDQKWLQYRSYIMKLEAKKKNRSRGKQSSADQI